MAVLAAVFAAAGVLVDGFGVVALAADAVLFAGFVADALATPRPATLTVDRVCPERAGLEQEFERVVTIEPGRGAGLELELREEFAPVFEVVARDVGEAELAPPLLDDPTGGPDRTRLAPDAATRLVRRYRSSVRGVHTLGDLRLRVRGPLGLLWRQSRLSGEQQIAIEPALLGLARTLRLAASERWQDLGVRRLRRRGGLTEFESLRDYVHGDDPRFVDWKAFARHGRPFTREYQEERGQELILLVDTGRRMAATTSAGAERGWTKLDHALDAALQLAAVALDAGDRVAIGTIGARLERFVAPARGRRHFARLRNAVFDAAPSGRESDLGRALRELAVLHRRRAMLVIVTDIADPLSIPAQRRALQSGSRRHKLVLAALDDPSLRVASSGVDPETGTPVRAAVRAEALALSHERATACAELAGSGARILDALPAEAAGPLLAAWLDARRAGV